MGKFNYDEESTKQAKEKSEKRKTRSGSGIKLNNGKTYLVILPPTGKGKSVFKEVYHYTFGSGPKFMSVASGSSIDETDAIQELGFKLYKKFSDKEKHKKTREKIRNFMPKEEFYVNAVKLKRDPETKKFSVDEAGALKLPSAAAKLLMSEIDEVGVKGVCDPDTGKIMFIQDNGQAKLMKRYDVVKWMETKPQLISKGLTDEETLTKACVDLDTKQKEFSEKEIEKLLKLLKAKFKDLVNSLDDEEEESDEPADDDLEVDDDAESDEDADTELDDEEEEEKPKKKVAKKTTKKVEEDEEEEEDDSDDDSDDDADSDDEDLDDIDDEDLDSDDDDADDSDDDSDDEEEEEEKPAKSAKKVVKKAASKKK